MQNFVLFPNRTPSKRYRTEPYRGGVPETGDEQVMGKGYTYDDIMKEDATGAHLSIKNRDKACSIWIPMILVAGIAMVGITELLSAKWDSGNAILRSELKERNDDPNVHNDYAAWAWAHIIALCCYGLSLIVVIVYFAAIKPLAYDKARGCAKNDDHENAKKLASTTKWYCGIFSFVHFLIVLYALIIMFRSFWELGGSSKGRDAIGTLPNFEAVMIYYLMWGFGSILAALGNMLASILFYYNARFVVQACGGWTTKISDKIKRGVRKLRGSEARMQPSRQYYDAGKRY